MKSSISRTGRAGAALVLSSLALLTLAGGAVPGGRSEPQRAEVVPNAPAPGLRAPAPDLDPTPAPEGSPADLIPVKREEVVRSATTVGLFALMSLAPVAALTLTAFVRISIVLNLLRQALGSPQVPGNQVLMALALMLTVLVMKPQGEAVYQRAIQPYAEGRVPLGQALEAGAGPIRSFMIEQIHRTGHERYLAVLYDYADPPRPGRVEPTDCEQLPLRVVAPAFVLSELTTALVIGFQVYLPFLVVDLVVSSVLAAMGLVMLPPSLVAVPTKLVLFVLADGWLLVAEMLLRTFGAGSG